MRKRWFTCIKTKQHWRHYVKHAAAPTLDQYVSMQARFAVRTEGHTPPAQLGGATDVGSEVKTQECMPKPPR